MLAVAACASPATAPARPMGVTEHLAEADRHEADAERHDLLAQDAEFRKRQDHGLVCGDRALATQATSGAEPLTPRPPCWTSEADAIASHRTAAAHLRADARAHRALARQLLGAARAACDSLPELELAASPFSHRRDIAAVEAVLEGDRLRGARIRFAPLDGLSADFLLRSLTCHRALAAAGGYQPTHLASSPAVIPGSELIAVDTEHGPVVEITATDPAAAIVIYARAEALLVSP